MKKEIALELLKQTKAMAKKPKAKTSKWATKEGLQQVKSTLTRETLKHMRQMSSKAPGEVQQEGAV